jgi:hydrogenase maturation factor
MQIGKLSNSELQKMVFSRLPKLSDRTLIGASIGADCAWISLTNEILIASSDPITAGGMQSGTLAVHVSCNDIAAAGVRPIGILIVILVPPSSTQDDIVTIVDQASAAAKKLGVDIVGGHTEVTESVNTIVVTTTAFGISDNSCPQLKGKAIPGDTLLMTKSAAIEGTWIISMNHEDRISNLIDPRYIREAKEYLSRISVVEDGVSAAMCCAERSESPDNSRRMSVVHFMHDATEGGVLGASYEMAEYSGIGLEVNIDLIPVDESTKKICSALNIDPLRMISSGSMLIATSEPDSVCKELIEKGIPCAKIGTFIDSGYNLTDRFGNKSEFIGPQRDEIYTL